MYSNPCAVESIINTQTTFRWNLKWNKAPTGKTYLCQPPPEHGSRDLYPHPFYRPVSVEHQLRIDDGQESQSGTSHHHGLLVIESQLIEILAHIHFLSIPKSLLCKLFLYYRTVVRRIFMPSKHYDSTSKWYFTLHNICINNILLLLCQVPGANRPCNLKRGN